MLSCDFLSKPHKLRNLMNRTVKSSHRYITDVTPLSVILMLNIVKYICLLSSLRWFSANSLGTILRFSYFHTLITHIHFIMVKRDGKYLILNHFNNNIIISTNSCIDGETIYNLARVWVAETFDFLSMQVVSIKVNAFLQENFHSD